jgi:hypothetical protein
MYTGQLEPARFYQTPENTLSTKQTSPMKSNGLKYHETVMNENVNESHQRRKDKANDADEPCGNVHRLGAERIQPTRILITGLW